MAVTDDRSSWTAQRFIDELQKTGKPDGIAQPSPGLPLGFVYHSLVAYTSKEVPGAGACPTLAGAGVQYLELSEKTKGVIHQVCKSDWAPIFKDIATSVQKTATIACAQKISYPADGSVKAGTAPTTVTYYDGTGTLKFRAILSSVGAGIICPGAVGTGTGRDGCGLEEKGWGGTGVDVGGGWR